MVFECTCDKTGHSWLAHSHFARDSRQALQGHIGLTLTRAEECRAEGGRARWEIEDYLLLVLLLVCFLLLAAPLERCGPAFLVMLASSMAQAAMEARRVQAWLGEAP